MKITKNQLKQLISEEIKNVLSEDDGNYFVKGDPEDHHGYHGYSFRTSDQKAAQEKTPAPAVSTDEPESVEEELNDINDKLNVVLAKLDKLETTRET